MPVTPTFPGIYIEELPSSTHTITAAPTNIAVFIGYTDPLKTKAANWGKPVQIFGFSDYERQFGGFFRSTAFATSASSFGDMATAVNQFFLNGGSVAYIVGLYPQIGNQIAQNQPLQPTVTGASLPVGSLTFMAREITDDTFQMTITIRVPNPISPPSGETADVIIAYGARSQSGSSGPGTITETYRQVSLDPSDPNYIVNQIGTPDNPVSSLVTIQVGSPPGFFEETSQMPFPSTSLPTQIFNALDFTSVMQQDTDLDKVSIFNLLIIPGVTGTLVMSTALAFCERKRAFLVMDPPINDSADGSGGAPRIEDDIAGTGIPKGKNAALYFPYLKSPDPLTGASTNPATGKVNEIPPSATVAGIFAATDVNRGVWKAPAGFQATTTNTTGVVDRGRMTNQRQGVLNPLGVNCLRDFPNVGTAVFGARTLVTQTEEQWRYVPVRRMALFLEQTLYANLGWVVFEPNDVPLWNAIRTSIESFMLGLFRQGAFQGSKPSDAFQVKCDSQTTTQDDINNGIVNIVVAFAPLKPAEFVIIKIAQLAGQTQTS